MMLTDVAERPTSILRQVCYRPHVDRFSRSNTCDFAFRKTAGTVASCHADGDAVSLSSHGTGKGSKISDAGTEQDGLDFNWEQIFMLPSLSHTDTVGAVDQSCSASCGTSALCGTVRKASEQPDSDNSELREFRELSTPAYACQSNSGWQTTFKAAVSHMVSQRELNAYLALSVDSQVGSCQTLDCIELSWKRPRLQTSIETECLTRYCVASKVHSDLAECKTDASERLNQASLSLNSPSIVDPVANGSLLPDVRRGDMGNTAVIQNRNGVILASTAVEHKTRDMPHNVQNETNSSKSHTARGKQRKPAKTRPRARFESGDVVFRDLTSKVVKKAMKWQKRNQ